MFSPSKEMRSSNKVGEITCSFCPKTAQVAHKMISTPSGNVCDTCSEEINAIMSDKAPVVPNGGSINVIRVDSLSAYFEQY